MNSTLDKIAEMVRPVLAIPGSDSIIDLINPKTGLTHCYGKSPDQCPGSVIMELSVFCAEKSARQDAMPKIWEEISEERYQDMLEVLPPAAMKSGAFLVGEAQDHHAGTGQPRFSCFKSDAGKFYALSKPITHAEFCEIFGKCAFSY